MIPGRIDVQQRRSPYRLCGEGSWCVCVCVCACVRVCVCVYSATGGRARTQCLLPQLTRLSSSCLALNTSGEVLQHYVPYAFLFCAAEAWIDGQVKESKIIYKNNKRKTKQKTLLVFDEVRRQRRTSWSTSLGVNYCECVCARARAFSPRVAISCNSRRSIHKLEAPPERSVFGD